MDCWGERRMAGQIGVIWRARTQMGFLPWLVRRVARGQARSIRRPAKDSSVGNQSWRRGTKLPTTPLAMSLLGIELSPTFFQDKTLLVVDQENTLHLSQDGGTTWQACRDAWRGQSLLRAHFAPDSRGEIVALTMQPTDSGHFNVTVWRTGDLGHNWEVLAGLTSGVPAVAMAWPAESVERAIYLATQHRVIKLYFDGDPPELQVYQHFFDENLRVTALAVAPKSAESNKVWAATTGGIYASSDHGLNWVLMIGLPQELPVLWLEVTDTHLTAITLGGRVWRAAL